MDLSFLPGLNASLNLAAACCLVYGRSLARGKRIAEHRRVMSLAFGISTLFLCLYVLHKWSRGFENTTLHVEGLAKTAYLVLLFTHLSLAMSVPFLAVSLVVLGVRGRVDSHRRLARWAWPIWIYVSITGVVIYLLLYHLNPGIG